MSDESRIEQADEMSSGTGSRPMTAQGTPAPPPEHISSWNLPNFLTVLRIVMVPLYVWLLLREDGTNPALRWAAYAVFALAMITDGIDGRIARSRGQITNFGKVSDPIADKALTGAGFIGLSILDTIPWWMTILVLSRELGITLMRFIVIRHGVMPAGRGGKLKTFLQTLSLGGLTLPLWAFPVHRAWEIVAYGLLWGAVIVTLVTGLDYVLKAHTLRQTSARTAAKRAARASEGARVPGVNHPTDPGVERDGAARDES